MSRVLATSILPATIVQALGALGVLLWRVWDLRVSGLWTDLLVILSAFALVTTLLPQESPWRRRLAYSAAGALFMIYAVGQVVHFRSLVLAFL